MQFEECIIEGIIELDPICRPRIVGLLHGIERNDSLQDIFLLLGEIPALRYRPSDLLQGQRDPFCEVGRFDFQRPGDRPFTMTKTARAHTKATIAIWRSELLQTRAMTPIANTNAMTRPLLRINMHAAKRRDQGMIRHHRAW